jgi:hypothetical protein
LKIHYKASNNSAEYEAPDPWAAHRCFPRNQATHCLR